MAAASARPPIAHHSVSSNLEMAAPAEDIMDISGQEELGENSKPLGVKDFELVKTLGTGTLCVCPSLIQSNALQRMD